MEQHTLVRSGQNSWLNPDSSTRIRLQLGGQAYLLDFDTIMQIAVHSQAECCLEPIPFGRKPLISSLVICTARWIIDMREDNGGWHQRCPS